MKINYYEAFDLIAEEAVDLLAEHQSDDSFLDKFSVEDTLSAVQGNMTQKTVAKKRIPMKIRFLLAAVIVLIVSAVSFAGGDDGAELITDENRHLVGKESGLAISVFDKDGNLVYGEMPKAPPGDEIWKTSTVIKRVKNAFPPSSITEIAVKKEGNLYITPEIIFWNGDMVILTKDDGSGWKLKKGQTLTFDVELYPNEALWNRGQYVGFYKIRNGVFYGDVVAEKSNEHHYEIKANRRGEYYIAFANGSSDSISFKEGIIKIQ